MGDTLRKKLSPGDICTQSGGLTHKNQLFLVIDVKEKAETALVVPVTTDYNPGSRIIQINHIKYCARVAFQMELPLITLAVVPELRLDNLQETLTKLRRNLHPEEKNKLTQTTSAKKQAIPERGKTSASNKTLPPGTICILNKKCKDKRLLAINARYFLILESDGKTVNAVPLYYNTKSKNLAIKINGVAFCVLTNSSVSIPLNSISVIEKMKLDEPEKIIEKVKRKQCNPPKKRGRTATVLYWNRMK
ncbi:MAG: hypothetical protein LIO78_02460 [Clostridiales bacterium]|nr:hypothetical protein [Clostridiales bacterium]